MTEQTGKLLTSLILLLAGWALVFVSSIDNMISVWSSSETYKHCFLILPVVIYLLWERKNELTEVPLKPNWLALIPLIGVLVVHLIAQLMMINLVIHLSVYFSLVFLLWAILGTAFMRFAMFPIFFLIFAVPFGEELVPFLQQITADLSVLIIQAVGVPIYRDGLYLHVPGGSFVVAEACAGIRFLIATIAIGALYCYLFFNSVKRRTLFMLACFIIPIAANGIRAAGIVLVGYYSDMEHAVGADHLVYGWVFFSIVLGLIILVGQLFQEPPITISKSEKTEANGTLNVISFKLFLPITIAIIFITIFFYSSAITKVEHYRESNNLPVDTSKMTILSESPLKPSFNFPNVTVFAEYSEGTLFMAHYAYENSKRELINWNNRQFDVDLYSIDSRETIQFKVKGDAADAEILNLTTSHGQDWTLVYTYQVGTQVTHNALQIKGAQLVSKLGGTFGAGTMIQIAYKGRRKASFVREQLENLPWQLN